MASNHIPPPTGLDPHRFPVEPWRLVESEYDVSDLGHTETLFGLGNGYLGMRGNPEEGRDAYAHGTFVNGFHETWEIQHAENAFGFAKVGQTIVNVPDAKLIKLYVDDEPLLLSTADLVDYETRPRLPFRPARTFTHVANTRRQERAGAFDEDDLGRRTTPRRHDVRGHVARLERSRVDLVATPQPPGRRRRIPRRVGGTR